jgi:hypothetical protein
VALIASLIESGVDFVAVDMPLANRFTIHILAAVAEYVKWPRVAGPFLAAVKLEGGLLVVLYQAAKGFVCCCF